MQTFKLLGMLPKLTGLQDQVQVMELMELSKLRVVIQGFIFTKSDTWGSLLKQEGLNLIRMDDLLNAAKVINADYSKVYNNEINAYQVQYSFDGSYPMRASSLRDINVNSLREIKDANGKYIYRF